MQLVQHPVPSPQSPSQQMQEPRGYQKQPKHSPILTIKNLFDIQSESSSSVSATSSLQSDHSLQSSSTPFNRSNTSSISTYDNSRHHHQHAHSRVNHHHKEAKRADCGLAVANFRPNEDDCSSELENSPIDRGVVLEVYEQKKSKGLCTTTTIEPRSSASSTLNFNFDFDNWSLDELPQMDDGKFSDRIQHTLSNDMGPEVLVLTPPLPPPQSEDIEEQDQFSGDVKDHGFELNSMIESMKELTLLDRFKGMIRKNSTNMFKRLNSSSFDLALFKQGGDGIMEDGSTRILPSSSALSIAPSPSKIKFEEYVASEFEPGQAHTMPSASTCTPTPITPNNYHPTRKHKRHRHSHHHHHHHHHHQKCARAQLSTPSSSSTTSPKRKKSFLHFRSASLPFNLFDFKSAATSSCNCSSFSKHPSASFILNHPPKSILKCKVNQNYNQESIESIKQDSMQFDEFWRKFELMEQAKNNYSNDDLLNSMRLEQVRNYYYDN